jgi:hypothetical protein
MCEAWLFFNASWKSLGRVARPYRLMAHRNATLPMAHMSEVDDIQQAISELRRFCPPVVVNQVLTVIEAYENLVRTANVVCFYTGRYYGVPCVRRAQACQSTSAI